MEYFIRHQDSSVVLQATVKSMVNKTARVLKLPSPAMAPLPSSGKAKDVEISPMHYPFTEDLDGWIPFKELADEYFFASDETDDTKTVQDESIQSERQYV